VNFQGTIEAMRVMILSWLLALGLWAEGVPVTAGDLLKMKQVAGLAVSADGQVAVYGVRSAWAKEGKYGYWTHLWKVRLGGGAPVQLTFGERKDALGALSRDGRRVAFLREGEKGKAQVWVLSLDAGGEAEAVTSFEQGATAVEWRPDGRALLVTAPVALSKIEGTAPFSLDRPRRTAERKAKEEVEKARPDGGLEEVRAWLQGNEEKANPAVVTRLRFLGEQGLAPEMAFPLLYEVPLEGERKAKLVGGGFRPHNGAKYSPDGTKIAYTSAPESKLHPDRVKRTVVRVMQADGSDDREVAGGEAESFGFVEWTALGGLLLTRSKTADKIYQQGELWAAEPGGRLVRRLAEGLDATPASVAWVDEEHVVFTSAWQGGGPVLRASLKGGKAEELVGGPRGATALAAANGRVVYALTEPANPNELYLRERSGAARRLTELNTEWLAGRALSRPEEHWLTRPDGTRVQYWVMKPARAEAGKRYPWVLEMHGGPAAMWGPGEASMWQEFQVLCGWGYGVVYANPRGSGGYGQAFLRANYQDWGAGPAGDVLAALDEVVKSEPLVDKDRLFLTGGSYAGYLTAWIVGHDRRFRAAAAQRGVYDLKTFYGEGNAFDLVEGAFGGFPWEARAKGILERESPFTYVDQIETPLLILHASEDLRTGVTQSEMLFRALEQRGKDVEYVRYPGEGHELTRSGNPGRRMDHLLRIVEFFERYK